MSFKYISVIANRRIFKKIMTTSKKADSFQKRQQENRKSRITNTQAFIEKNTSIGLLNNHKWYQIFEWLHNQGYAFELKALLSEENKSNCQILELEERALLIDNS